MFQVLGAIGIPSAPSDEAPWARMADGFFDRVTPARFRDASPNVVEQARFVVLGSGAGAFFAGIIALIQISLSDATGATVTAGLALALAGASSVLWLSRSAVWAARYIGVVFLLGLCALSYLRGGFAPWVLMWTALVPIGVVAFRGPSAAKAIPVWLGLILATVLALFLASPGQAPSPRDAVPGLISVLGVVLSASGLSWLHIRAQRRLEATMRELERRRALGERLESVGRLAGGFAHQFNNILAVIRSHAEIAIPKARDPELVDHIERIEAAAARGGAVTRKLLSFGGESTLQTDQFDPVVALSDAEGLLGPLLPENVELSCASSDGLWDVRTDIGEFEHALLSLTLNARDAMPDGGHLLIRAENVVVGSARSDLDPELEPGRYVRVVVEDDGVGMEPRVRDRVFDPFFTTHALGEGTGLGLASVYGFCRRVGGAVTVESAAGCGSKFSLYLPAGDSSGESAKMATTDEDVDRPVGEGITVLVVEDEDEVRDVTALALRSKGFRVLEARDGVEAIQTISSSLHPVAIVLTDVIMPRMSGTKLAARIRELHPELPVIFMSGYVDDPRLSEDPTLTLAGILRKPFSVAELVDAVSQALPVDPRLVADSSSTGP